jgi:hypothetical protein
LSRVVISNTYDREAMMFLLVALVACGGGENGEDGEALGFECQTSAIGNCEEVDSCCSREVSVADMECEYRVDGTVFPCDGSDCNAAATELAEYCT